MPFYYSARVVPEATSGTSICLTPVITLLLEVVLRNEEDLWQMLELW